MKKLFIVLFISLFFCGVSQAFTAQTKGTVLDKAEYGYFVWIDGETVSVSNNHVRVEIGDDVLISVEIDGPKKPVLTIVYNFRKYKPLDDTRYPADSGVSPPGSKF